MDTVFHRKLKQFKLPEKNRRYVSCILILITTIFDSPTKLFINTTIKWNCHNSYVKPNRTLNTYINPLQ